VLPVLKLLLNNNIFLKGLGSAFRTCKLGTGCKAPKQLERNGAGHLQTSVCFSDMGKVEGERQKRKREGNIYISMVILKTKLYTETEVLDSLEDSCAMNCLKQGNMH